jgi:hypothetical protein
MVKSVKRGLYAERAKSGKRNEDFRFVIVEDPEVWHMENIGSAGLCMTKTMVVYRAFQGMDNIRLCMERNRFMSTFNFVTNRITTRISKVEEADTHAMRRYKEAHSEKKPAKRAIV